MKTVDKSWWRILFAAGRAASICAASCGLIMLIIGNVMWVFQGRGPQSPIENKDIVQVRFESSYGWDIVACYDRRCNHIIAINPAAGDIAHELKHSYNHVLFARNININAEELSAQCAGYLSIMENELSHGAGTKDVRTDTVLVRNPNYDIPGFGLGSHR